MIHSHTGRFSNAVDISESTGHDGARDNLGYIPTTFRELSVLVKSMSPTLNTISLHPTDRMKYDVPYQVHLQIAGSHEVIGLSLPIAVTIIHKKR